MQHHVQSMVTTARAWYRNCVYDYSCFRNRLYQLLLTSHARVLHVGGRPDELLDLSGALQYTVIDYQTLENTPPHELFDYVIISLNGLPALDIQRLLIQITPLCGAHTRIIIDRYVTYADRWRNFVSRRSGVYPDRMNQRISAATIHTCLRLAGFELITHDQGYIFPWAVPGVSLFLNACIGALPGAKKLGYFQWCIARPPIRSVMQSAPSVSIIIPCKNEKGTIERALQRIAAFGSAQEFIFIEGNSSDGTREELYRVQKKYPEKNIQVLVQKGKGKRDAVYQGFAHATGDILMILDADLTVTPEELPRFYHALCQGSGEFINGSRLVYPMEEHAMQRLNFIANHGFSIIFSWIFGQKITDTLCGTKVFYKKDLPRILLGKELLNDRDPFGDFDLLCGAARVPLKIIEVPVHYRARSYGSTQIRRFYHGMILIGLVLRIFKKFKIRW